MTGFIATNAQAVTGQITNDGFFPDIDLAAFIAQKQIRQQITPDRIRRALAIAMIDVNNRLITIKTDSGSFDSDDDPQIDGVSQKTHLYLDAVYSTAKAALLEEWRNYDLTLEGQAQAEQAEGSIDDNRRKATYAISLLLGKTSANQVELI